MGLIDFLKYNDFPFAYSCTLQDKPSLFAGKLHALLCREYIKGRDWYDFIWYTSRKTQINFPFLSAALNQQGRFAGQGVVVDAHWCHQELIQTIKQIDWEAAKNDVKRFVVAHEVASIDIWCSDFFLDRLEQYNATTLKANTT